jgi:hypothetical protein
MEKGSPLPGYKGGSVFENLDRRLPSLDRAGQGAPPARDASGESDYGNIDGYGWDNCSELWCCAAAGLTVGRLLM